MTNLSLRGVPLSAGVLVDLPPSLTHLEAFNIASISVQEYIDGMEHIRYEKFWSRNLRTWHFHSFGGFVDAFSPLPRDVIEALVKALPPTITVLTGLISLVRVGHDLHTLNQQFPNLETLNLEEAPNGHSGPLLTSKLQTLHFSQITSFSFLPSLRASPSITALTLDIFRLPTELFLLP